MDALITHARSRIGYNIVRSLGRQGLTVAVGSDLNSGMARFSRFATKTFTHPNFKEDPEGFIEAIEAAIDRFQPRVYLPTEEDIFLVAHYRERLEALGVVIPIDSSETLELLNHKSRITRKATELGIPAPKTREPTCLSELTALGDSVGYPLVLKVHGTAGAHGVYYLDAEEMESRIAQILADHDTDFGGFLVQQYVQGHGWGVSVLCRQGKVLRSFAYRRVRERIHTGGPSTVRESARNPRLEDYAARLAHAVGLTGVAMIEFKEDSDGNAWFLEVNPRFWGSVGLAVAAGVDFPHLLYRLALGDEIGDSTQYRTGVTAKWVLGDLYSLWNHRRARLKRGRASSIDCYDDLYWDDPLPFVAQVALYVHKGLFKGR